SFLARSASQQQRFTTFDAFVETARDNRLKCAKEDWLPPGLLAEAISDDDKTGEWSIVQPAAGLPKLVCVTPDGDIITGTFTISGGRVRTVTADIAAKPLINAKASPKID